MRYHLTPVRWKSPLWTHNLVNAIVPGAWAAVVLEGVQEAGSYGLGLGAWGDSRWGQVGQDLRPKRQTKHWGLRHHDPGHEMNMAEHAVDDEMTWWQCCHHSSNETCHSLGSCSVPGFSLTHITGLVHAEFLCCSANPQLLGLGLDLETGSLLVYWVKMRSHWRMQTT